MTQSKVMQQFIEESKKMGFEIIPIGSDYVCKFQCDHCGKYKIEQVYPRIDENGEVQCKLPIYCNTCRLKGVREIVWERDIESPYCPEYVEHHKGIQEILHYIDKMLEEDKHEQSASHQ